MLTQKTLTEGYISDDVFDALAFSQVVTNGSTVYVAGTAALRSTDGGLEVVSPGDQQGQLEFILDAIDRSLALVGASKDHLVAWTIFTTDIAGFMPCMPTVAAWLGPCRPTSTTVEVSGLVDPGMLLEINAIAELA